MKKTLTMLVACLLVAGVALADAASSASQSVRSFKLKFKDAEKAVSIIKPLLSAAGSVSLQPSANSLVVTDRPENLKSIAAVLNEFDAAPRPVTLSIHVVAAGRGPVPSRVTDDVKDVAGSLSLLGFNTFENLGKADVEGREGEPAAIDLGTGYRVDFRFGEYDPATDSIRVAEFRLSKVQKEQVGDLYRTSLNLKNGQTIILSVKRPQGQRALSIALVARR